MRSRMSFGSLRRSAPATLASPADGVISSVASMRSVVVLPAPFGPRKPKISPGADLEVDAAHRLDRTAAGTEGLLQVARPDHGCRSNHSNSEYSS